MTPLLVDQRLQLREQLLHVDVLRWRRSRRRDGGLQPLHHAHHPLLVGGIRRDVVPEVVEGFGDVSQIDVCLGDVVQHIGVRLDGIGLFQLGDPALHLPRRDQGHAVAKVPLRIRPRIGDRRSGGEEGNERERSAHVCARGQWGRAFRVVHAVVIPLLVRVVLVSGRSLLWPRLGRARLRAPHRHAHCRVLAFHLAAERYRPVSVPPHRDLKDPPRGHAQMERGPPEKVAIRVPYLGAGRRAGDGHEGHRRRRRRRRNRYHWRSR